jgi:hypothetical protein
MNQTTSDNGEQGGCRHNRRQTAGRPELGKAELGLQGPRGANRRRPKGGLHMNNEPNTHLSQEGSQWMKDMFQELSEMFEELFPDTDSLNLEEMQRRLDEQQADLAARTP